MLNGAPNVSVALTECGVPRMSGLARIKLLLLLLALATGSIVWQEAECAVINVTTSLDEVSGNGECSLREAILAANADKAVHSCESGSGADSILLPPGNYRLSLPGASEDGNMTGDLDIIGELKVLGSGAAQTVIDAQGLDRVFDVLDGATVTLSGITVQQGNPGEGRGGGIRNHASELHLRSSIVKEGTARTGGGIANEGSLLLEDSLVNANVAFEQGGGIFNEGLLTVQRTTLEKNEALTGGGLANLGTVIASGDTWSANTAGEGGAIANLGPSLLSLTNCTLSGNQATRGGGLYSAGQANIRSCTLAENSAEQGGGIFRADGFVKLSGTLLGQNRKPSGVADDCAGAIKSLGYNLIQMVAGCEISGAINLDLLGMDPDLEPLGDNGGSTRTHALKKHSPAVDAVPRLAAPSNAERSCPAKDQRDRLRPMTVDQDSQAQCDIGAYELDTAASGTAP